MTEKFYQVCYFSGICFVLFAVIGQSFSKAENKGEREIKKTVGEIHGYHFHTYFFQTNQENTQEALTFRRQIQAQIDNGFLANCRMNRFNREPVGPHPIGSFETCCNKSSISPALTWFMENHGNLSILLHPLTRYEVLDHTERAMFLGKQLPLDISPLSDDLHDKVDMCQPLPSGIIIENDCHEGNTCVKNSLSNAKQ